MATSFPSSLDSFSNPSASDAMDSVVVPHAAQHADANDAIEALEAKVGVNNSAVTTSLDYKVRNPELVGGGARPLLTGGAYIDGTNGLVLSGLSGNYASTPDSAALSITGDIDIKLKLTATNWATNFNPIAKWVSTGNQRSYWLIHSSAKTMRFITSNDGSATGFDVTSSAHTFANGDTKWIRVTADVDDGSGNRVCKFYTSDDGTTWTQLGTTSTVAGTTSIFDGTAPLDVGSQQGNTPLIGTVHRVIIQSAFDTADNTTSVVFDADFEAEAADTLAFTEDSTNAATVSVTTTRYTVGIPGADFSSITTYGYSINRDWYEPFTVTDSIDVDMIAFEVTTGPASAANMYLAIYETDDNYQPTGTPLVTATQPVGTSATGVFYVQFTPITLKPGTYAVAHNQDVAFTSRVLRSGFLGARHTLGASSITFVLYGNRTAATFTGSPTAWTVQGAQNAPFHFATLLRWKAS